MMSLGLTGKLPFHTVARLRHVLWPWALGFRGLRFRVWGFKISFQGFRFCGLRVSGLEFGEGLGFRGSGVWAARV